MNDLSSPTKSKNALVETPAAPAIARFLEKALGREVTLYSLHERAYHVDHVGSLHAIVHAGHRLDVHVRGVDDVVFVVTYELCEAPDYGNNDYSTALCLRLSCGIRYALIHLSKK